MQASNFDINRHSKVPLSTHFYKVFLLLDQRYLTQYLPTQQLKMMNEASHHTSKFLGIPKTCSLEEIEKQCKKLAIQLHPDNNKNDPNSAAVFQRVSTFNIVSK
jgi:hypothetical protein